MFYIRLIILLFISASVYAHALELTQRLDNIHSWQASFIQTIKDNRGHTVQRAEGLISLIRPGKFRWEVIKPIPQLIIANGSNLWIYDKDLEQVQLRSLHHATGETPALLLSHADMNLEKSFTINTKTSNDGLNWFQLRPKQQDSTFALVELGFKANQLKEMHLKDNFGHTTIIQFSKILFNQEISASLFTFKIPAHVDVINERRPG